MSLSIQYQVVQEQCSGCGADCDVVRGPVFRDGEGAGLYMVLLHRCSRHGDAAIFTVVLLEAGVGEAYTFQAWPADDDIEMTFMDSRQSPWAGEGYLGRLLTVEEARDKAEKETVFQVADLVCESVPEVSSFLAAPRG